jgi:hypothetical protein
MIAANRQGRAKTQDGRSLRRAKRRWKIERLFAWLHNCRRVVTRWERHVENYLGWCSSPVPASCVGPQSDSLRRPDGSTVGDNTGVSGGLENAPGSTVRVRVVVSSVATVPRRTVPGMGPIGRPPSTGTACGAS